MRKPPDPKSRRQTPSPGAARRADAPYTRSRAERLAAGRSLRRGLARSAHAEIPADRRDAVKILEQSNRGRIAHLVPIRYGRMLHSPFAFMRGAAAVMAHDLGGAPHSTIVTQLCGDCHLNNFGGYASPERELLFGINDFDETLPGPFEWDLKRLATSFVIAARDQNIPERHCIEAAQAVARSYRTRMLEYAQAGVLDLWYARVDVNTLVQISRSPATRRRRERLLRDAGRRNSAVALDKLADTRGGELRFIDQPPLIYHARGREDFHEEIRRFWKHYVESLPEERRKLLDHFRLLDVAMKVVGVGSVGTRCAIALLMAEDGHPLLLQFKEARTSVYEPFAGASRYHNHGLRVVVGQRLMQSQSDIFLGFSHVDSLGADFYVRQLRDMKVALDFENMSAEEFIEYGEACGWVLARAHARSGDPGLIAGYLGKSDVFDRAIGEFAHKYADRNEADHAALVAAVKSGRVRAEIESAPARH
jgi:uncharacterized protein (DUF2252 family)